jgi:hypothetical protein
VVRLVIVPRLARAAVAGLRARRLARRFPLPLDSAYFARLLRARREGASTVAAVAYGYGVTPARADGLARALTRALASAVDVAWLPAVAYGADEIPVLPQSPLAAVVAAFNPSATPEPENHGAFVRALAARIGERAPLIAIVDASDFTARFRDDPRRLAERQAAWRELLGTDGADALFANLAEPDLPQLAAALSSRLAGAAG